MARITGPIHSDKATGSVAKTVVFQRRPSGYAAYGHRKPKEPGTPDQQAIWERMKNCSKTWGILSAGQRAGYAPEAKWQRLAPFHAYQSHCCKGEFLPLTCDFDWNPPNPVVGQTVYFTVDPNRPTYKTHWDFGDGGTSEEPYSEHIYQTADTFTVAVQVWGSGGTTTQEKQITISAP